MLAGFGLLLLIGYAFSWVFAFVGAASRQRRESAKSVGFIVIFPLTFISSAFVPPATMPEPLRWFASVNPFTIMVDAMRALWPVRPRTTTCGARWSGPSGSSCVFAPLAVARYRRATGS